MHGVSLRVSGVRAVSCLAAVVLVFTGLSVVGQSADASGSATANCSQPLRAGIYSCFSIRQGGSSNHAIAQGIGADAAGHGGYGPADLRSAYNIAQSSTAATVAIIDAYDDPDAEADLAVYRQYYGLPACTTATGCFRKVNQDGSNAPLPAPDQGWAGEIALDLAMVSAACPSCHLLLVEADQASSDLFTGVQTAVGMGAKYVSMSWGSSETASEQTLDQSVFGTPGVVFAAASGDDAYGVSYPAASAHVVAVGGTSLSRSNTARGWSESAWSSRPGVGTGSGCSTIIAKPSWQASIPSGICPGRAITDIAADADPATGVAVYQRYGAGGWVVYGGTSAAAPLITAMYALAGPSGSSAPASILYAHPGALNDITTGRNGSCSPALLCSSAPGWDGPTGLGSPNGIAAFTSVNTVRVISPGAQTSTLDRPAQLQISGSDSGGANLSFAGTGLPPGLAMNPANGVISGSATALGSYAITVTATGAGGTRGSATFGWVVRQAAAQCSGQALANGGFSYGSSGWIASKGVIQMKSRLARTGQTDAQLGGAAAPAAQSLGRAVSIPAGCGAVLTYALRVLTTNTSAQVRDALRLTVTGHRVQAFSNLNRGGYVIEKVRLTGFGSGRLALRWTAQNRPGIPTSFLIDDVSVTLS
jgi:hypothetical protein